MSPIKSDHMNLKWESLLFSKDISSLPRIKFAALNVCSIIRKMDDVVTPLHNSDLKYLRLSESWLNYSISDSELLIPSYVMHRFDRDGGLAL